MNLNKSIYTIAFLTLLAPNLHAFTPNSFSAGIGYYSENIPNKTAQREDGSTKYFGEVTYPLNVKYDYPITQSWLIAPQLSYVVIPRKSAGDTAKVTNTQFVLQVGQNWGATGFDWYFGPGIFKQEIKGNGGTVVMNNGTGTATFAVPGRKSTAQKIIFNIGTSFTYGSSRLGLDLFILNIASNSKRSQNFMVSYSYIFGGNTP